MVACLIKGIPSVLPSPLAAQLMFLLCVRKEAAALNAITAKDIHALMLLTNQPGIVRAIFDGVLLLLQKKIKKVVMIKDKGMLQFDDSYKEFGEPMISEPGFLDSLLCYPKEKMNDEMVELLAPYTERCAYCLHACALALTHKRNH